ncbi:uncharacterized protein LOC126794816 [Argentina anserina]|uniref:uncharacterized protein LOC126794816 n=1 Tax=Argentina anserina TaxID=57926 RepID=UPI002176251A|nr:uncharacterized protein LOC126794816 [Potentilla anserina]
MFKGFYWNFCFGSFTRSNKTSHSRTTGPWFSNHYTMLGSKEHLQSKAVIYSPARTVAQQISGSASRPATCSFSRTLYTATAASESRSKNHERIADSLLDLTKIERHDYSILFRLKIGLNQYGPAVSGIGPTSSESEFASTDSKVVEKIAFDIKLEKFDVAAKIKIIKEVRTFTDLGLKDAKDLMEQAPVVLKKGVTKEDAGPIVDKLKELGATVILE